MQVGDASAVLTTVSAFGSGVESEWVWFEVLLSWKPENGIVASTTTTMSIVIVFIVNSWTPYVWLGGEALHLATVAG